jgi:hypothetical protein
LKVKIVIGIWRHRLPGMNQPNHVAIMEQWAEWGKGCQPSPQIPLPDWSAVEALIDAARPRLLEDSRELCDLVEQSRDRWNFADPLLCDLGMHRWLEKEKSYSDWLAWVLERLHDTKAVLRVLGIPDREFDGSRDAAYTVEREWAVVEGNEGSTGRIDLLIRFKDVLIGVEVKTEDRQYDKQRGYKDSLEKLGDISGRRIQCVLIANCEVPDEQRFGFKLRTWADVSVELRCAISEYIKIQTAGSLVAAMMLGFVAAVEQNLLGFGTAVLKRAQKGWPTLLPTKLFEYLERINGTNNTGTKRLTDEGLSYLRRRTYSDRGVPPGGGSNM